MLTIDYDRLDLQPGMSLLDMGCGAGRHSFEAFRRGAQVVALDYAGSHDGAVTFEIALESAGELTFAAA